MLRSDPAMRLRGGVFFRSKWNLQLTAAELAERLFNGIPFSDEVPGLRDEVPAVMLTKEVLGLVFVLYGTWEGEHGLYTLDAEAGHIARGQYGGPGKIVDIGPWLAQLVGTIPEFEVVGHSPIEIRPPSA